MGIPFEPVTYETAVNSLNTVSVAIVSVRRTNFVKSFPLML